MKIDKNKPTDKERKEQEVAVLNTKLNKVMIYLDDVENAFDTIYMTDARIEEITQDDYEYPFLEYTDIKNNYFLAVNKIQYLSVCNDDPITYKDLRDELEDLGIKFCWPLYEMQSKTSILHRFYVRSGHKVFVDELREMYRDFDIATGKVKVC